MEYSSAIKRNETLPFSTTCLDLKGITPSGQKDKTAEQKGFELTFTLQHTKITTNC